MKKNDKVSDIMISNSAKTEQMNLRMSARFKKECKDKADSLGISVSEFFLEAASKSLYDKFTNRQNVKNLLDNQNDLKAIQSFLKTLPESPDRSKAQDALINIAKREAERWLL